MGPKTYSAGVEIRSATLADTRQMSDIAGGSTTPRALADWMDDVSAYAAWHLAEDAAGRVLGFQRIGAQEDLGNGICEISTFLRPDIPPGIGSRLFEVTAEAARKLGYAWIEARMQPGNEAARTYYQSNGFRLFGTADDYLAMRYDLT